MTTSTAPIARRGRGRSRRTIDLMDACTTILKEIAPASVRAVCYRLFAMKLISSMSKAETDRISRVMVEAREEGLIPWESIVDETREAERISTWGDPSAYVECVGRSYRRDRWALQPRRIEVWSEKGTVRGTLSPVLQEYGVTFRVFHGFNSATGIKQIANETQDGVPLIALYCGDYDPSGMCMSEVDLPRRLQDYGAQVDLRRIALVADDLATVSTFPLADKMTDSRSATFQEQFGDTCAELDALSPVVLRARVRDAIESEIEPEAWSRCEASEAAELHSLDAYLSRWARGNPRQARKCPRRP